MKQRLTLLSILLMASSISFAQHAANADSTESTANQGCVDVVVDGQAALSYDCLNQQLAPKPEPRGKPGVLTSEEITQRPSNSLGLFNQSTFMNRMGDNAGKSATRQENPAPKVPHVPR